MKFIQSILVALILSLAPYAAYAHEGGNVPIGDFLSGLIHPVLGFDHLLAMLSVGILSAQIGGRAIWTVPTTFVAFMAVGGALGLIDIGLTSIEAGIAVSLVILGLVIAADRRVPVLVAMIGVAIFAIFHGYAHGSEMPKTAQPALYALGFLVGTAAIHIVGVIVGDIAQHYRWGKTAIRIVGVLIALIGIFFIFGVL